MDQNSMPPGGGSDRSPEDNVSQRQGQPSNPQNPEQPISEYPPPQNYTSQEGQATQGQPQGQGSYVPSPAYPQASQGYPQQGGPPPGYPPQAYPQGAPPPGYAPPPGGYPPQGYPPQGYPPQNYGPPPKKSGMPVWGWILITLGILGVLACALVFGSLFFVAKQFSTASPRLAQVFSSIGSSIETGGLEEIGVVFDFYDKLESHDYQAAHGLLGPQLAEKYTAEGLRTKWEALEKAAGKVTPGLPNTTDTSSDQASITQELTSDQGKNYSVNLKVERLNSTWQITEATPDLIPSP